MIFLVFFFSIMNRDYTLYLFLSVKIESGSHPPNGTTGKHALVSCTACSSPGPQALRPPLSPARVLLMRGLALFSVPSHKHPGSPEPCRPGWNPYLFFF